MLSMQNESYSVVELSRLFLKRMKEVTIREGRRPLSTSATNKYNNSIMLLYSFFCLKKKKKRTVNVTTNQDYWISLSLGCHFCVFELSRQIPKIKQVPKLVKTIVTLSVLSKILCEYICGRIFVSVSNQVLFVLGQIKIDLRSTLGPTLFPMVGSIKKYLVKENLSFN